MPMTARVRTVGASLVVFVGAVILLLNVLSIVHWSSDEIQAVSLEAAAVIAFVVAVYAHFKPETPGETVALAATFTAAVVTTIALLNVFDITDLDATESSQIMATVAAAIGVGTSLFARNTVWSERTHVIDVAEAAVPEGFAK